MSYKLGIYKTPHLIIAQNEGAWLPREYVLGIYFLANLYSLKHPNHSKLQRNALDPSFLSSRPLVGGLLSAMAEGVIWYEDVLQIVPEAQVIDVLHILQ